MSGGSDAATSREQFLVNSTASQSAQLRHPLSAVPSQADQQNHGTYSTTDVNYLQMTSPHPHRPEYHSISGGATGPMSAQPINMNAAGGGGSTSVANQPLNMNSGELKRKRGRPRKYGPDGSMTKMVAQQQLMSESAPTFSQPAAGPLAESQPSVGGSVSPSVKKARGRPPGSSNKKKQLEAIGSTGIGFIPHVINVKAGEDVSTKVMAFSQNGPRTVCILSSSGAISNVTLRQSATSGGTATYEGRFDILSLSGSFMLSESDAGGPKSRTGGLSITLAGPDGRVFGGCVAGLLIAASPVQVIVGSFLAGGRKEAKPTNNMEQSSAPPQLNFGGAAGTSSSPSHGTFSESSGGPVSPPNLTTGACNNNHPQGVPGIPWK